MHTRYIKSLINYLAICASNKSMQIKTKKKRTGVKIISLSQLKISTLTLKDRF